MLYYAMRRVLVNSQMGIKSNDNDLTLCRVCNFSLYKNQSAHIYNTLGGRIRYNKHELYELSNRAQFIMKHIIIS